MLSWRVKAACRAADPTLFYTAADGQRFPAKFVRDWSPVARRVAAAKAVCARCPVIAECLVWALEVDDEWAILGGLTPAERAELRKVAA